MSFTQYLWKETENIYNKIINHPFIEELTSGELPKEKFEYYIQQDSLYLADFSRALGIAGTKSPETIRMNDFFEFAKGGLVVEQELHRTLFKEFDIKPAQFKEPACFSYTNYLLAQTSLKSYEEGVAALLPCFWIYAEVGNYIVKKSSKGNPYQAWIDTYSGEEFNAAVEKAIEITEEAADNTTENNRLTMKDAFLTSSELEWNFWNDAYTLKRWEPKANNQF